MDHAYELMDRGVEDFKRDTFESSLRLGVMALARLGINNYRAHRLAQTFRHHNRTVIENLYQHHKEDEKKYLSEAKKHANELEELFRTENKESDHLKDCSWDVTTRREEVLQILTKAKSH